VRRLVGSEMCIRDRYISVPDAGIKHILNQKENIANNLKLAMDVNPWEHLNYFDVTHLDKLLGAHGFVPIPSYKLNEGEISIGLRPEENFTKRLKNGIASAIRLSKYILKGDIKGTPTRRFYRFINKN
jgi:hypothetical protein